MNIETVSDVITMENVEQWEKGNIVTVKAGTGVGKSHFIKHSLYTYAKQNSKKILMLLHRRNCLNQFKKELLEDNKLDIIDLRTYQSIESLQQKKVEFDFSKYDYIVCDEFHYFMGDAGFNKTTDISLNVILKQTDTIQIFMSATGFYMKNYINNFKKLSTIDYELEIDYNFIDTLTFFNTDETMDMLINDCINNGERAILFIQSATKAYDLRKKYKEYSLFNCSESAKYYKYVDVEKRDTMLEKERFDDNILITTTALDAGVNIIDMDLKHIIVDVDDVGSLIQCIGRKRIKWRDKATGEWMHEKVNVYVKNISNQSLGGKLKHINKRIEKARYLRGHTVKQYVEKYGRDYDNSHIVYDDVVAEDGKSTKKVNELMFFKSLIDREDIKKMLGLGKDGYVKYINNMFGKGNNYIIVESRIKTQSLQVILDKWVGVKLYKDEQKGLIDAIDFKVNRIQQKSYNKLNYALDEVLKLPYVILPKKSNSTRYWIIEKICK